jgi:hypothetical protein
MLFTYFVRQVKLIGYHIWNPPLGSDITKVAKWIPFTLRCYKYITSQGVSQILIILMEAKNGSVFHKIPKSLPPKKEKLFPPIFGDFD